MRYASCLNQVDVYSVGSSVYYTHSDDEAPICSFVRNTGPQDSAMLDLLSLNSLHEPQLQKVGDPGTARSSDQGRRTCKE